MSKEIKIPVFVTDKEAFVKAYAFRRALNRNPDESQLQRTPDGKAKHVPIDIIQALADRIFYLGWGTENVAMQVIGNEIACTLSLWYIHPVTGLKITQTGAAAAQITVDALTNEQKGNMSKQEINLHSTNIANKKPNALHLVFPKVVVEAEKNAFKKIGNIFGRNLNRTHLGTDLQNIKALDEAVEILQSRATELPENFTAMLNKCTSTAEVRMLNDDYGHLFDGINYQFELAALQEKNAELLTQKKLNSHV